MIKAEVVFDGDCIYYNGRLIEFVMGAKEDYWQVQDIAETFLSLEKAISYCLENVQWKLDYN